MRERKRVGESSLQVRGVSGREANGKGSRTLERAKCVCVSMCKQLVRMMVVVDNINVRVQSLSSQLWNVAI